MSEAVDGRENKFLLFGLCREDFVEVNGNAKGNEEKATDAGNFPVRGLEGGWSDELVPE